MMTFAPLPSWAHLLGAAARRAPTGAQLEQIARPWIALGETVGWLSRSAWSLALVATWRQRQTEGSPVVAWIPDFFCNASLAPLRATGARLRFYPVDLDMRPDFEACRSMAATEAPDLFVLVHYMGRPNSGAAAREFCAALGAWLIEDAAHVLYPRGGIGSWGDFVLFSPHKHLPIPEGAVLVARASGPSALTDEVLKNFGLPSDWPRQLARKGVPGRMHRAREFRDSALWLAKRTLQKLGVRNWRSASPAFSEPIDGEGARPDSLGSPEVSVLTKRLLPGAVSRLDEIADVRSQNQTSWDSSLMSRTDSRAGGVEPAERSTRDDWTPYLAAFRVDYAVAEEIYDNWTRCRLPVMTWPDLPPEVKGDRERYANAWRLRHGRLYLPVHQTLSTLNPARDVDVLSR